MALTETPLPVRFDIKTMDTLGVLDYPDHLPKKDAFESAHPQIDAKANEKINYLIKYGRETQYVIYRVNPENGAREVISEIPVEEPAYMHSFALTEHNIILVEFPFVVHPLDLMFSSKGYIENFAWQPERGTRFIVIDRRTGKFSIIHYTKSFFAFHHVNAYESQDDIILDMITYPDANVISSVSEHGHLTPDVDREKKLDQLRVKQNSCVIPCLLLTIR